MKYCLDVALEALRRPGVRLAVSFAGLMIAMKIVAYGWGARLTGAALFGFVLWGLYSEWRRFLPAFRRMMVRRTMRIMKALRPLRQLPPDVPVIYGAVMMYMIIRVILVALQLTPPRHSASELFFIGLAISIGALRHAHLIVARIAKWSWGKVLGKALYAVSTAVCVAVGAAQAIRMTRLLTHADAKYFPSFLGLLSSWYVILNFVRCAAIFLAVCGLVLLLINLPSLFLRSMRGWFAHIPQDRANRIFFWWRRVRLGRSGDPAIMQGRYLRDVVELFTPIALMVVAAAIISAPESIAKAQATEAILNQALFAMEYTADGGCPAIQGNLPTVHLDRDFVSTGVLVGNRLVTTRQECHASQNAK
ncbi:MULTISPECIES: hypothetical protein [unclassified Burkholderia]|uniref:hypothetical protein n=1 Tax=unclassified Burkholderia TaxID=2613784 RepID=UPI0014221A07|nr:MULTISPECIES: hypothetical protein [unclassified Burkholderia]NIE57340.1 hypothetical protein [Burkholderia sp. Ap-955]NIF08066.1 hypothetical protein [Burkholderia sp. Ax-1735]NIG02070.1 hypothetical protein [Burkholderia sp. Tr-849]